VTYYAAVVGLEKVLQHQAGKELMLSKLSRAVAV
jgi:hypothetical protein